MSKKRNLTAGLAALGAALGFPGAVSGQQAPDVPPRQETPAADEALAGASVVLKVNGMVCPFCAYGLEQRLQAIPSIDAVLIRVSDGVVQIRTKEDQELTDEVLADEVKKAGFVITEIERIER